MTTTRTARQTGTRITVGTAEEMELDPAGGKWTVVCETHGAILNTETKKLAERHATDPQGWCEGCREGSPALVDLPSIQSPRYSENRDRFGGGEHGDCLICGKAIRNAQAAYWAEMTTDLYLVPEGMEVSNSQGAFPIGPDCYRKHRDVLTGIAHRYGK